MDKYETRTFWVKLHNGDWRVAERRHSNRWFICGDKYVLRYDPIFPTTGDIIEIGAEIICPYMTSGITGGP